MEKLNSITIYWPCIKASTGSYEDDPYDCCLTEQPYQTSEEAKEFLNDYKAKNRVEYCETFYIRKVTIEQGSDYSPELFRYKEEEIYDV